MLAEHDGRELGPSIVLLTVAVCYVDRMPRDMDDATIKAVIAQRQQRQWMMVAIVLAGSGLAILGGLKIGAHISMGAAFLAIALLMLPLWVGWFWYTRSNWRCPACDAPLPGSTGDGYMWRVPACPMCGRELR